MKDRTRRACGLRQAKLLFHLAENLRFAEDHRVEARGNTEYMPYGLASVQMEDRTGAVLGIDAAAPQQLGGHRRNRVVAGRAAGDYLDAVARGQHHRFSHWWQRNQILQERLHIAVGQRQLLPDFDRCGVVADSYDDELVRHAIRSGP